MGQLCSRSLNTEHLGPSGKSGSSCAAISICVRLMLAPAGAFWNQKLLCTANARQTRSWLCRALHQQETAMLWDPVLSCLATHADQLSSQEATTASLQEIHKMHVDALRMVVQGLD